jgi:hypothetical protein
MVLRSLCALAFLLFLAPDSWAQKRNIALNNGVVEIDFELSKTPHKDGGNLWTLSSDDHPYLDGHLHRLALHLPYGDQMIGVVFEKTALFADDFRLTLASGKQMSKPASLQVYYGSTSKSSIKAFLTVHEKQAHILLMGDQGVFEIKALNTNQYIAHFPPEPDYQAVCDQSDDLFLETKRNTSDNRSITGDCIELYIEVDHVSYSDLGSSTVNVTTWVTTILNSVRRYFDLVGVPMVLSELFVWDIPDPYMATNTLDLLNEFKAERQNNYNGRIAHLFTTRDIGGGIADGIGGFCQSYPTAPSPFAVSGNMEVLINGLPNYNYSVNLVAHELGHVMGARHTHACVWNGNNTQIDDCGNVYATQQGDFPEGTGCYDVNNPLPDPVAGGTIMSRCNLLPVGINLLNGFHPQVGQLMFDNYSNAPCQTGIVCSTVRPSNDLCSGAIALTVKNACVPDVFDNFLATSSGAVPGFSCGSPGAGNDVWFSLEVPSSGSVSIETTTLSGGLSDMLLQVYSGACGTLSQVQCDDNSGVGNQALVNLTGRTPGEILFVRIVDSGSNDEGTFGLCAYDASIPCHPQINDLVNFYNATGGTSWTNRNGWQQGASGLDCDVCSWFGITCNANNQVSRIQLSNNNLTGNLPSVITSFQFLELLDLSNNILSGGLPADLDLMDSLVLLDLSQNNLSGGLGSDFPFMDNIAVAYLGDNNFDGGLPLNIGNADFNILHLQNNNLTGCIPASMLNLCSFVSVDLMGNPLHTTDFLLFCADGTGGDIDGDAFCAGSGVNDDCLDSDANTYPGAPEICDGIDNDCDGSIDEGVVLTNTYNGPGIGDWNVASNWTLGIVPELCHEVVISNDNVNIQAPTIGRARSVQLNGSAALNNFGLLQVQGSSLDGILVNGSSTFTNNGSVTIDDIIMDAMNVAGNAVNNDTIIVRANVGNAIRVQGNASFQNAINAVIQMGQQ